MENETKYPLIIIGVALVALIAFNSDLLAGKVTLQNAPTTYKQEQFLSERSISIPTTVARGKTIDVIVNSAEGDMLPNKEKVMIYTMNDRFKKQFNTICKDGYTSACKQAKKSFSVPFSWEPGDYKVQIEREARENGKFVKEILGRAYFTVI